MSANNNKRKVDAAKLPVDCTSITETLWLVKLPEFVGEYVATKAHDEIVGKLKVRKTAPNKANPKGGKTTTVELSGTDAVDGVPSLYSLEEKTTGVDLSMLAFSEKFDRDVPAGKQRKTGYTLHGKVTKNMVLRPEGDDYTKLLRDRSVKTYMRREIQVDNDAIFNFNNMNHIVNFKPSEAAMQRRQAEEADKANRHLDDADGSGVNNLRLRIFDAFATTDKIKQQDLHAFCSSCPGYTSQRVKDILEKCAKYHQKGTFKHFWELNAEYKGKVSQSSSNDAGTA